MSIIPGKIRAPFKAFTEEIKSASETTFLALLILRMIVFFEGKINWSANKNTMLLFSIILKFGTMIACAIFLLYIIVRWKEAWKIKLWFFIPAAALALLPLIFNYHGDDTWYFAFMDLYFCLMAYGKDYKKIIKCYVLVAISTLLVALIGLPIGLTQERSKMDSAYNFSFGIVYPNTWGQIFFLILIIIWYLFLQKKIIVTLILFWATAAFMYLIPKCKTIMLFAIIFPVITLFMNKKREKGNKPLDMIWIVFPFICFIVTMILCWQMDWVKKYAYGTPLESMAMRFVQGGIAFKHYGFPIIGHTLPDDPNIVYAVNGVPEVLYVVDNAFVTFGLFRGAIWMLWALCWLTYANWKGLKNRDRALVLISAFIMVFAIMERPGLEGAYNFMFLYPLASVAYLKEPEEKFSLKALFAIEGNQNAPVKKEAVTKKKHK